MGPLKQLYLISPVGDGGYGTVIQELCLQFLKRGIEFSITPAGLPPNENDVPPEIRKRFVAIDFLGQAADHHIPIVQHFHPHSFQGFDTIVLKTTYETEVLPETWARNCNTAKAVILQTQWLKNAFRRCGVTAPIYIVPEGISASADLDRVKPPDDRFRFFAIDKAIVPIIQAFRMAFEGDPSVELVVKARSPQNRPEEFQDLPKNVRLLPIAFSSPDVIDGLYNQCHCLVHPVEGAGWGLPICEAISRGIPVIANRHTAIQEYTQPGDLLETGFEEKPFYFESWSPYPGLLLGTKFYPTLEGMADAMVAMKKNYASWKAKTLAVRERLIAEYSWDKTAERFIETIEAISNE